MKILFAGEEPVGGSSNYLLGVLKTMRADVVHVPSSKRLRPSLLQRRYDLFLFSDFPKVHLPVAAEREVVRQVRRGAGLLMIGGWCSFAAPRGGWRGSAIESLLPVTCRRRDDRVNIPGGALIVRQQDHPIVRGIPFTTPPAVIGLNAIQPKAGSRVVLSARTIVSRGARVTLSQHAYPLLVVDGTGGRRAALATDAAPHWCGGLLDWGARRLTIRVAPHATIDVGHLYVRFLANLIRWLAVP